MVTENKTFTGEIEIVCKLLAAWPYLDVNMRRRIVKHAGMRFPKTQGLMLEIGKDGFNIPKGNEFVVASEAINKFASKDMVDDLQIELLPAVSEVQNDMLMLESPYNLVQINDKVVNAFRVYLEKLYIENKKQILSDLIGKYNHLAEVTNEVLRFKDVFSIPESNDPRTFEEFIEFKTDPVRSKSRRVVSTGFPEIDAKINERGLVSGRLSVLQAKSGTGKSSFAMQMLGHIAIHQKQPVMLLSYEMDAESSMARILSQTLQMPVSTINQNLANPELANEEIREMAKTLDENLTVWYPGNTGEVHEVESRILDYQRVHGRPPAVVVVDYIQQLSMGEAARHLNKAEDYMQVSRTLRGYGQDYNTHIIVASQVTEVDGISRAYGGAGIEFAADHVFVIGPSKEHEQRRILKFKKNRHGPDNQDIELGWNAKITSFFNLNGIDEIDIELLGLSSTMLGAGEDNMPHAEMNLDEEDEFYQMKSSEIPF